MAPDQVPPNNFPNTLDNCTIRQYPRGMTNTTDPRVETAAKAWDKHMGGRYAPHEVDELSEEVAVILAAADAVDPRKPRTITTSEEVDALPVGSVVLDTDGFPSRKFAGGWRTMVAEADGSAWLSGHMEDPEFPATVLWEPEA